MTLEATIRTIALPRPFRIAHGTSSHRETVLVSVRDGDLTGWGEGALPPYYPSRANDCLAWLRVCRPVIPLPPAPPEAAAARVAVEMALQDLAGQRAGAPLWKLWDLDPAKIPPCPTTLSIPESEDALADALAEARAHGATALKLKSGSGDPLWDARCAALVAASGLPFSVDANAGWSVSDAAALIPQLAGLGVLFVEQPVDRAAEAWRDLRALWPVRSCPLVADESLQDLADLRVLAPVIDGVNIKILKAGGLDAARRWITAARHLNLRIMIGVMVETGIGRTAAAHLAPLADWLDIDPPASIPVAPLCGFTVRAGRLTLSDRPGLGLMEPLAS